MKKSPTLPAVEPDWSLLRLRYEARDVIVADIAKSVGISVGVLTGQAKALGWVMRSHRRSAIRQIERPKPIAPELKPITSTKEAINRLKLLVQQRIARLEQNLMGEGDDKDRGINAANLLARTLEKVLELEEQQRKQQRLISAQKRNNDDSWREELAGRIARLNIGNGTIPNLDHSGGKSPATGLASVGA